MQWGLTRGGAGDFYSNDGGINQEGEQIVGFAADVPRRIQEKTGTTNQIRAGNLTFTKTDGDGTAENILEGTPQRTAKIGRVSEVNKEARVVTSIKLKAGEMKGDMVDVAGQAIAGIPGLITMPAVLLYRTTWAASGAFIVPVIDWEECTGGWSGTISITRRSSEFWSQDGEKKGVRGTTASASTSRTYKYQGTIDIKNAPARSSGVLNRVVTSISVELKGEANATSETVNESESSAYYEDNCGQRQTRRVLYKNLRIDQAGSGQGEASGRLFIDLAGNQYSFHIAIPAGEEIEIRWSFRNCR